VNLSYIVCILRHHSEPVAKKRHNNALERTVERPWC
jgi:hypothetical protein